MKLLCVDCTILTSSDTDSMKVTRSFLFKLDAYLRSPGVSVGSKLHFWACICLSFFYAIIGLSYNCFFSRYDIDAAFSHMYAELKTAFVYVVWRPFLGVGWRKVVLYMYIIAYCFNTYYWTLLSFFLNIELINFSFAALCIY